MKALNQKQFYFGKKLETVGPPKQWSQQVLVFAFEKHHSINVSKRCNQPNITKHFSKNINVDLQLFKQVGARWENTKFETGRKFVEPVAGIVVAQQPAV